MAFLAQFLALMMGTGALAWAYCDDGQLFPALGLVLLALFWTLGLSQRWTWVPALGLFLLTAAAAAGLWLNLPFGWMLAGALGALLAYDLADFNRRLRSASKEDNVALLERAHLFRLAILLFIGLGLSTIAILVQLQFTFEWLAFLALAGAWGVSMLVGWLRGGGE